MPFNKQFQLYFTIFLCIGFCSLLQVQAQVKSYNVYKAKKPIQMDGKLQDRQWKKAKWIKDFEDIEGENKPAPLLKTKVKMLWDDTYLYFAVYLQEPDLWATLKNHDDIIFRDHDFEIFLDPNNDQEKYFEIEVNAFGQVMDLFMYKPYKKGGKYDMNWNTTGTKLVVRCLGTINNNLDKDKGWIIEMALPFECLAKEGRNHLPTPNQPWRLNFSRVQWTLEKEASGYTKKLQSNGKPIAEHNWVWSPTGVVDIHLPEKWGLLNFKN